MSASAKRRVGIVGYGKIGQYLVDAILSDDEVSGAFELAFVWNRTPEKVLESGKVPPELHCADLADFARFGADLIVEVAHPAITREFGEQFVAAADYMVGSPTIFADPDVEAAMRKAAAADGGHGVYIPAGAFWGATVSHARGRRGLPCAATRLIVRAGHREDGRAWQPGGAVCDHEEAPGVTQGAGRAAAEDPAGAWWERGRGDCMTLTSLQVLDTKPEGDVVIYDGPVRGLCPLAPNNVNTMAAAALAAPSLGFDKVAQ